MTMTEAEAVVTTARADLARLALQLRSAQRAAEHAAAADALREGSLEVPPARDVLRAELADRIGRRRQEQAAELAEVQAAAEQLVVAARADAAALLRAASASAAEVLLAGVPVVPVAAPAAPVAPLLAPATAMAVPTLAVPVVAPALAPTAAVPEPEPAPRRGFWHDVAYADVVLPLVAVVLVLIVLVAWVA